MADQGATLYVVATPIGNLGDMTARAIEVLRAVPLVAAEDTRVTRKLWARFGIETRMVSYHALSPRSRRNELLSHLASGEDLALVTDAGTPLVSDPGGELVSEWILRGGAVVAVPGASAVLAALLVSGLPTAQFVFEGFLPLRGGERRDRIERICRERRTTVIYESAVRSARTLADLALACGGDRPAALCRELTKMHEEVWRGTLDALVARAKAATPRGEVTLVIGGVDDDDPEPEVSLEVGRGEVDRLVREGMSRSSAAREVANRTGLARRDLFRER